MSFLPPQDILSSGLCHAIILTYDLAVHAHNIAVPAEIIHGNTCVSVFPCHMGPYVLITSPSSDNIDVLKAKYNSLEEELMKKNADLEKYGKIIVRMNKVMKENPKPRGKEEVHVKEIRQLAILPS